MLEWSLCDVLCLRTTAQDPVMALTDDAEVTGPGFPAVLLIDLTEAFLVERRAATNG